ncbi:hypothetical protein [Arhodomonas sp. SL1]|uniref:hypothetical protein n=1 Tax=Arhodomonas sp. SL1 TaxID=3425691 RepID=UPI003F880362
MATGKEVITHTDAVSVPGWSGAGYVIFDPKTGAGAWKIGGGVNGGSLDLWEHGKTLFWALLGEYGGKLGDLLNNAKSFLDHTVTVYELVKNCPTVHTIMAIISITMMQIKFAVIGVAFAKLGPVVLLSYALIVASIMAKVTEQWAKKCV